MKCIHGHPSSHFVETYGISIFWTQWNTPLQKTTFYLTLLRSTKTQPFSDKSCDYILPHQSAQRWSTYHNLRRNSQQKLNTCLSFLAKINNATCFYPVWYFSHANVQKFRLHSASSHHLLSPILPDTFIATLRHLETPRDASWGPLVFHWLAADRISFPRLEKK